MRVGLAEKGAKAGGRGACLNIAMEDDCSGGERSRGREVGRYPTAGRECGRTPHVL